MAGEIDNSPNEFNHENSDCAPTEIKEPISSRRGHISDGRSPMGIMEVPISQQSPAHDVVGADSVTSLSGKYNILLIVSFTGHYLTRVHLGNFKVTWRRSYMGKL